MLVFFEPIFILGLWAKFIWEKLGKIKIGYLIPLTIVLFFGALNVQAVVKSFDVKSAKFDNTTLGEVEFLAFFIKNNTPSGNVAYVDGSPQDLFKLLKSMQFIASTEPETSIAEYQKKSILEQHSSHFYIGRSSKSLPKGSESSYDIIKSGTFGRFNIFELKPKQNG